MNKRARRLWFGDWQRDDEEPDVADTFVILPDDAATEAPVEPRRNVRRGMATVAGVTAVFALVFALTSGRDDGRPASATSQAPPTQTPQPQVPQGAAPGFGGADLTGPSATDAAKAALARYPGDIERVTQGPGGSGYVVHVIQADGSEVHVVVSDEFKILGSDAGAAPRGFGGGSTPPGATPQGGSTNSS